MLKTLVKKQLLEIWQGYFVSKKTGKARSKTGTMLFFLLFGGLLLALGFAFYSVACGLGGAILGHGFDWLYFSLMGLLSIAFGVFGSVFNTYAGVYLPKDNELLLSLPIPGRTLLLARLSGVYLTGLLYSAWIWIPSLIAYLVMVPVSALQIVFPLLMTFIIALFVTVLSCILGWVVALIAVKAKGKSFVTVLGSLVFVVLYYVIYFKMVDSLEEMLTHIGEIGNTVQSWFHYAYWLGCASAGDALSMLIVVAITLALAGLCFLVLSRTFTRLSLAGGSEKKSKVPADYTAKSVRSALVRRELKHFTSVSTWMLNGGFGLLILPVAAVALIIKSGSLREQLPLLAEAVPELYGLLPAALTLIVGLILSADAILPVSVSIEGKTLWQLQSLPIAPWDILRAKEGMSVRLNVLPNMLFVLVAGIVLQLAWWQIALVCLAVWIDIWLVADFGLLLNLKMPQLNWTNAAFLTKQSMPVLIYLFGGWAFCVALGVGGFFLGKCVPGWGVLCAYILVFAALWWVLHTWLKKKGTQIFAAL